jgi:hypothetical protein
VSEEDVAGFQIAVDNSFAADVAIGLQELSENGLGCLEGQSVGITMEVLHECAALQEFCDEIDVVLVADGVQ